ncbi:MAG: peptidylprolyl isomerase [Gammaproteobacteria bacterium]|nr:peptidylprolyl isomerase [Gammaproteobacteria bacterium]
MAAKSKSFLLKPIKLIASFIALFLVSHISFASQQNDNQALEQSIYQLVDLRQLDNEIFSKALKTNNVELQINALHGLGRIGGETIIPLVSPFLNHSNEQIRQYAALALGLSGSTKAGPVLWQALEKEESDLVKHEIYLSLGNLGPENKVKDQPDQMTFVKQMLNQTRLESSDKAKASIFHGITLSLLFHPNKDADFAFIDYKTLLSQLNKKPAYSSELALFLSRIPDVQKYISGKEFLSTVQQDYDDLTTIYLLKLAAKITANKQDENREILAWILPKAESKNLGIKVEAARAMINLVDFTQTQIQLGKMQGSDHPIISQTALKVLADSDLNDGHVIRLFKDQLKHKNPAMVVEAINGLIKRQKKDDMSWGLKIFQHPSDYVKIKYMQALSNLKDEDFSNLFNLFAKAPQPAVSKYAKSLLTDKKEKDSTKAVTPDYQQIRSVFGQKILFKTTAGEFTIQLLQDAPYTSWNFYQSVKSGFYDAAYFNRVIGNFVVQGGDPIGDGEGTNSLIIREEINLLEHVPMSVGIATDGKDTGSSQFFINTTRNIHLDRRYTIFAKVISGQDVVYRIAHGDRIVSAEVLAE